jgi:origin recognition complex subunit 2
MSSDEDEQVYSDIERSPTKSPRKRRSKLTAEDSTDGDYLPSQFIVNTSFDAYFTQNASVPKTSSNNFISLLPPLSSDEFNSAISSSQYIRTNPPVWPQDMSLIFTRFFRELEGGFNLLCYGYGSKRKILNRFAREKLSSNGHVVIVNAFSPSFALKDILLSIERNISGVTSSALPPGAGIEGQAQRIHDYISSGDSPPLYLVVHSIDIAALRTARARSILVSLVQCPHIHLIASVDHILSPLLWSTSDANSVFRWLWHDLTTLEPYDVELAHADRSSISGAHSGKGGAAGAGIGTTEAGAGAAAVMTETAAQHILASVTEKAKKLFRLLAEKQLERMDLAINTTTSDETGNSAGTHARTDDSSLNPNNARAHAIPYDALFAFARDQFIATNETAFRALLGEFRDHGLVLGGSAGGGEAGATGGEVLWIPVRKERLNRILKALSQDAA